MNKKGFILSTYVYILLVFFLLLLGSTLMVLNNTKLLANKNKQDSLSGISDFNLVLLGDKNITLYGIDNFEDPGYIASTLDGEKLEAKITKETINNEDGSYTNIIYYTVTYSGKTKQIERRVTIQNNLKKYIEYLYNSAASENGLVKDDTIDENIRYAGSDEVVKNYVSFDGDVWRIIGIVDGKVKLVKNDSIGTYSWDSSASDMNNGNGYNIWETIDGKTKNDGTTKSDINVLLNEGYYGGTYPSQCYGGQNNAIKTCPTVTINSTLKSMVDENAVWYLGGHNSVDIQPKVMYGYERGTNVYSEHSDIAKTEWIGPVGLMYPSDYGYAVDRTKCNASLLTYNNILCIENNWVYNITAYNVYWLIIPSLAYQGGLTIDWDGDISSDITIKNYKILPSVYLKSNVIVVDGIGTSDDPYILKLS